MGKYDEAIGNIEISIDISDIIDETENENRKRIELAEKLYNLVEEDIQYRQRSLFMNEDWAITDMGLSRKVCKFIYESLDLNVAHSWG